MHETRLGLSAAAHMVSARPNITFADLDTAFALAEDPVAGGITFQGGRINLPDNPGHGADIETSFLNGLERFTVSV